MHIAKIVLVVIGAVTVGPFLAGQTAQVTGTAKERSGTLLNGVRVTVKNGGTIVAQTATNAKGVYLTKAAWGKLSVECEAISDSTVYAKNPVVESVEIGRKSNPGKQDCTFDQVTIESTYWSQVGRNIEAMAVKTGNQATFNMEWEQINTSGLPPDAKAAAAHQLKRMEWSYKITDPTFKAYMGVDEPTLSRALKGDQKAVAILPTSVKVDVKAYSWNK